MDEDGVTSSIKWQWSRSRSKTAGFRDIDKATDPSYTPKDTDNSYYLRVTASYTDREGPNKSAQATSDYSVHRWRLATMPRPSSPTTRTRTRMATKRTPPGLSPRTP